MHSILTVNYHLHSDKPVLGASFGKNLMLSSNLNTNLLCKCGNMPCGMNAPEDWFEAIP